MAAALLQAATSSVDAPSSSSRVLSVSLYASRCAVTFFLYSNQIVQCHLDTRAKAMFQYAALSLMQMLACKERCFDCLLHQLLRYLAGSQHVSRLHVQRSCLLRRQLQLRRPGIHPRADHGYKMMRNPRCHAVPANAVARWSINDVGRMTSLSWQLCSVAWQPKRACPCPVLGISVGPACSCTSSS